MLTSMNTHRVTAHLLGCIYTSMHSLTPSHEARAPDFHSPAPKHKHKVEVELFFRARRGTRAQMGPIRGVLVLRHQHIEDIAIEDIAQRIVVSPCKLAERLTTT